MRSIKSGDLRTTKYWYLYAVVTRRHHLFCKSAGELPHWPIDPNKHPDYLGLFLIRGISMQYLAVHAIHYLFSDHIPILHLSSSLLRKPAPQRQTTKFTDSEKYSNKIAASVRLKLLMN